MGTATYWDCNPRIYRPSTATDRGYYGLAKPLPYVNLTYFTVVAEIIMQNIKESPLSTCRQTIPLFLTYVDDTFTAVGHDEINAFHHHLNGQNTDIQFTREVEENGKLPFLDCLVSRDDNGQQFTGNRHTPTYYIHAYIHTWIYLYKMNDKS